jgi:hypothetical protein
VTMLVREYVQCCSWSHMNRGSRLGARNLARLLVGWEDNSVVLLWVSEKTFGKTMFGSVFLLLTRVHC